MKEKFDLKPRDEVVGLIYLGYPDMEKKDAVRRPAAELSEWIDKQ